MDGLFYCHPLRRSRYYCHGKPGCKLKMYILTSIYGIAVSPSKWNVNKYDICYVVDCLRLHWQMSLQKLRMHRKANVYTIYREGQIVTWKHTNLRIERWDLWLFWLWTMSLANKSEIISVGFFMRRTNLWLEKGSLRIYITLVQ